MSSDKPTIQPTEPRTQNAAAENNTPVPIPSPHNGHNHDLEIADKAHAIIIGRTPNLTPELHADILDLLREGLTIKATCEKLGIGRRTFFQWKTVNPSFAHSVAQVREDWTHAMVDAGMYGLEECQADSKEDMVKVKKYEALAKFKLDVASRLNPRDYSQKQQVQMDVRSVNISTTSEELKELLNGS